MFIFAKSFKIHFLLKTIKWINIQTSQNISSKYLNLKDTKNCHHCATVLKKVEEIKFREQYAFEYLLSKL